MKIDKYELKSGEQLEFFEFVSIGQKGKGELENGWGKFRKDVEYEVSLVKLKDN